MQHSLVRVTGNRLLLDLLGSDVSTSWQLTSSSLNILGTVSQQHTLSCTSHRRLALPLPTWTWALGPTLGLSTDGTGLNGSSSHSTKDNRNELKIMRHKTKHHDETGSVP